MENEDPADVHDIVTATNAREHRLFAGRLDRHRLGFAEKAMMLALRVADGDFRDWDAIDSWARQIAAEPSIAPADTASAPGAIDVCTGSSLAWEDTRAMNGQAATAPQGHYELAGIQQQAAPRESDDRAAAVEAEKQPAE